MPIYFRNEKIVDVEVEIGIQGKVGKQSHPVRAFLAVFEMS